MNNNEIYVTILAKDLIAKAVPEAGIDTDELYLFKDQRDGAEYKFANAINVPITTLLSELLEKAHEIVAAE